MEEGLGLGSLLGRDSLEVEDSEGGELVEHVEPVVGLLGHRVVKQAQHPQLRKRRQRVDLRQVHQPVVAQHHRVQVRQALCGTHVSTETLE